MSPSRSTQGEKPLTRQEEQVALPGVGFGGHWDDSFPVDLGVGNHSISDPLLILPTVKGLKIIKVILQVRQKCTNDFQKARPLWTQSRDSAEYTPCSFPDHQPSPKGQSLINPLLLLKLHGPKGSTN